MNIKKQIPVIITLGNLLCGTVALILATTGDFYSTAVFAGLGIALDFFDGLVARLLQVEGELGKQLDSLADMVTSGVVPGIVMLQFMIHSNFYNESGSFFREPAGMGLNLNNEISYEFIGLLLTLCSGYRLAKFNIDTRQYDNFRGFPAPAMNLFVLSLPLIAEYTSTSFILNIIHNKFFLIGTTLTLSILMVTELPLFSLKFKTYSFKDNSLKYILLLTSPVLLILFKFVAVPIIILLYILLSLLNNFLKIN